MKLSDLLNTYKDLISAHQLISPEAYVSEVSPENAPKKDSLVFISKPESLLKAVEAQAAAVTVPESHTHLVPKDCPINIIKSPNPRLAMAIISKERFALDKLKSQYTGVSSQAFIAPSAQVSDSARIGPFAFIGENVVIGADAVIGASTTIQSKSQIGEGSRIHENVFIGHESKIGKFCEIHPQAAIGTEGFGYASDPEGQHHPIVHQGFVELEDFVHVGSGSKIDRGTFGKTLIKAHTKIDNICHIAHNCEIGRSSLITAGFIIAGSTKIGDFFTTGGRTTVAGHIKIADRVNLAGHSVVHKSINKSGSYYGYPLKPMQEGLKNNAAFGSLAKMRKDLKKVLKTLEIEETK